VFSEGTEELIKAIYKETYQAGQLSIDAVNKEDIGMAQRVIDSKNHFNGLVERARAHLYSRLTQESPEHLAVYKIESNSIENYRRMHHQFVNICEHVVEDLDKDGQQHDQETETAESTTDKS
jgi:phosphate:Na+ symporter